MNKQPTIAKRLEMVPVQPSLNDGERLVVNVIFTSVEGTAAALRSARFLAQDLGAVIQLQVTNAVPWPLPLSQPPVSIRFAENLLSQMISRLGLEAFEPSIHLYLCRDKLDALARILRPNSLIVIGGRKRWRPTEESRLVKAMLSWGHRVVFVSLQKGSSWAFDETNIATIRDEARPRLAGAAKRDVITRCDDAQNARSPVDAVARGAGSDLGRGERCWIFSTSAW